MFTICIVSRGERSGGRRGSEPGVATARRRDLQPTGQPPLPLTLLETSEGDNINHVIGPLVGLHCICVNHLLRRLTHGMNPR